MSFNLPKKVHKSPMPKWLDPMLATLTYNYFSHSNWIYECKFDGERGLAFCKEDGKVTLYSRNQQILNDTYPELIKALEDSKSKTYILDGEIIALDEKGVSSFERLQSRLQLENPKKEDIEKTPVLYAVFDMPYFDGYDFRNVPLIERKSVLAINISFNKLINLVDHKVKDGLKFYDYACKKGWEGIIAKNSYSTYQNRRSKDWLKFKCSNRQEFIIIGYTEPQGTRVGLGALLLGYYEKGRLCYAGKVGTGFDTKTLHFLHNQLLRIERSTPSNKDLKVKEKYVHWVSLKFVCEVSFTEWTKDGRLRHPRYVGIRTDKDPKEVIREAVSIP